MFVLIGSISGSRVFSAMPDWDREWTFLFLDASLLMGAFWSND